MRKSRPQIITVNGQPAAYLVPISPLGIEADIDVFRSLRLRHTLAAAQTESLRTGTAGLSMDAIDEEIGATRAEGLVVIR